MTDKLYEAKFKHPVPAVEITEANYGAIADDLYYLQSEYMVHELTSMIQHQHWGDDDTDYHDTMRRAHGTLQAIAYDGSRVDLIDFLYTEEKFYTLAVSRAMLHEPLGVIDSAGGLAAELRSYLPKD